MALQSINSPSAAGTENATNVWVKQTAIDSALSVVQSEHVNVVTLDKRNNSSVKLEHRNTGISSATNSSSRHNKSPVPNKQPYKSNFQVKAAMFSRNASAPSTSSDTESCTSSSHSTMLGRHEQWGWKRGRLVAHNGSESIVVQVFDDPSGKNDIMIDPTCAANLTYSTVTLAASVLQAGHVVLCNEYPTTADGNNFLPPHDLITLTHLHEPSVVESLQYRFALQNIYTFTGPVLLAVNPFSNLRNLYGESIMRQYWERSEKSLVKELPPHVYALADAAFRKMMRSLEDNIDNSTHITQAMANSASDQSILVSGESGSGKTVTTKLVMKYLAALSQRSVTLQSPEKRAYMKVAEQKATTAEKSGKSRSWKDSKQNSFSTPQRKQQQQQQQQGRAASTSLNDDFNLASAVANSTEAQVLQSNPILESFGNARTVRNDNSSRFGKFVEIQFTRSGQLVGAQLETYLLEKIRLLRQAPGERNFHIFYELLSGSMDARELSQYFIAKTAMPSDFKLTAGSGTTDRRDGVSDRETYWQLRTALNTMKLELDEVHELFSVTAALLHASNLTFVELPGDACELDALNLHLPAVCHLLGVTPEHLSEALCCCSVKAGNETVTKELSLPMAERGLEALLKETYGALFKYLVIRINDSIAFKEHLRVDEEGNMEEVSVAPGRLPAASIGVLDIFGFESFHQNSFEQLCINYCNEALQQQFNAFVLQNEQAEYEKEGIEWSFIEFPENQDVLDLIEKRGSGILSLLDDQCRAPGPSDKAFALEVYKQCAASTRFTANRKQVATLHFSVEHYAGPVEYFAEGFVEKNRDELPKESTELLKCSVSYFVQDLAYIIESAHDTPKEATSSTGRLRRGDSSMSRASVGGQFRKQLRDLRSKIDKTSPHYIRCLKPNDSLVPDIFDTAIVAEQLRCGGILEAVRVARAGFTQHYSHADFVRRYRSLAWRELSKKDAFRPIVPKSFASPSMSPKRNPRHSFTSRNVQNTVEVHKPSDADIDPVVVKKVCTDLLKVLCKKIILQEAEDDNKHCNEENKPEDVENDAYTGSGTPTNATSSFAGTRHLSNRLPPSSHSGSAAKFANWTTPPAKSSRLTENSSANNSSWKRGGVSSSDYAKAGLQMGKTKVFLRHKAFEILERLRSREQSDAATKLNAIFRMYLARVAYIPYRNAFRMEMNERHSFNISEEYKETKEPEYADELHEQMARLRGTFNVFNNTQAENAASLVDRWTDSKIRDAIHNPVPRHEWGKQAPTRSDFKWVLNEGVWIKNYTDVYED